VLTNGEVRVWRVHLDAIDGRDLPELSSAESERAARIVNEAGRARYISSHRALRWILSQLTGEPLDFAIAERGKPFLPAAPHLRFSLSHSGSVAVVAAALDTEVGVDVERIRALPDCVAIAERFFPPSEAEALAATPPEAREREFFRRWTRIEAVLKAQGVGLHGAGAEFPPNWMVQEIEAKGGYAAAVAAGAALSVRVEDLA
jgi:4'-phosphopantetheinyl transferase